MEIVELFHEFRGRKVKSFLSYVYTEDGGSTFLLNVGKQETIIIYGVTTQRTTI
jgi:hypothetical protein